MQNLTTKEKTKYFMWLHLNKIVKFDIHEYWITKTGNFQQMKMFLRFFKYMKIKQDLK
jgi:hypothetical protein